MRPSLYRYSVPLTAPLGSGEERQETREGLLLCLETADGATGWGEAAPLPGFSRESRAEAERALVRVAKEMRGQPLADPLRADAAVGEAFDPMPPSVQFAVESAMLEGAAARQGQTVPERLGARSTIELNGLIAADTDDVAAAADRYRGRAFRTVKLKVGRRPIDDDVARVHALARALDEDGHIRLDANRAWTVEDAVSFAEALSSVPLEHIEEPLADPERLPELAARTGLPVAIDETTRERSPADLSPEDPIAAVVLKPTLLGGLTTVHRWAQAARAAGAVPVVSASYESGLGLRMLVALAARLSEAAAGLSTYERLGEDVLTPRLAMEGPTVDVEATIASTVARDALERIPIRE